MTLEIWIEIDKISVGKKLAEMSRGSGCPFVMGHCIVQPMFASLVAAILVYLKPIVFVYTTRFYPDIIGWNRSSDLFKIVEYHKKKGQIYFICCHPEIVIKKRRMPRIARIVITGYPHHIIQRGHNRQALFAAE